MIPTTITLTLDEQSLEAINRLISALEKVNPALAASAQPTVQVNPTAAVPSTPLVAASTQSVVSTTPVPTAQAPVQQPITQTPVAEVQQPVAIPTSHVAQEFTVEQLQTAMASLVDAGKMEDIRALLNGFGVPSIMALQPDQYGALATALRGMGAQI